MERDSQIAFERGLRSQEGRKGPQHLLFAGVRFAMHKLAPGEANPEQHTLRASAVAEDKRTLEGPLRESLRSMIMGRECVFAVPFPGPPAIVDGAEPGRTKIYCGLKGGLCVLPAVCDEPEREDPGF